MYRDSCTVVSDSTQYLMNDSQLARRRHFVSVMFSSRSLPKKGNRLILTGYLKINEAKSPKLDSLEEYSTRSSHVNSLSFSSVNVFFFQSVFLSSPSSSKSHSAARNASIKRNQIISNVMKRSTFISSIQKKIEKSESYHQDSFSREFDIDKFLVWRDIFQLLCERTGTGKDKNELVRNDTTWSEEGSLVA